MSNTTSNAKSAPLPIISENAALNIQDALDRLYSIVSTYGSPLPSFADMMSDKEGRERILARAGRAYTARVEYLKQEEVRAFRQGVTDAVQPHIEVQSAAREQFLALAKEVRHYMPAFPTTVRVPVSEVSHIFPSGTSVESQVKYLHTMGYKVSKGADKTYSLAVELPVRA